MKRRDFIKSGALVGAGLTLGLQTRVASAASTAANSRINVALIGARNMGGKTHLPSLVGSTDCQLTAICDVDSDVLTEALEKAKAGYTERNGTTSHEGIRTFSDFREVMARTDIDAVLIATPDHWHVPISTAAVLAGKDVYVEKPLSLYVEEGRDLANLLKKHPAILQVGSQQRSGIRFLIARDLVRGGKIGEIKHVEVGIPTRAGSAEPWEAQPVPPELDYDMWVGPVSWTDYHPQRVHYDFRFVPEFSGGDITNWGAHYLDIAQWGLGMDDSGPVVVRGRGQRNPAGSLHTCFYDIDVDYEYASGATMKLKTGKGGVKFIGSEGTLYVNRGTLETDPPEILKGRSRHIEEELRRTGGHLENWLSCIRTRRAEDLRAPVEVGHRSATLCHLADIAMETGRQLFWDPKREIFKADAHANAQLNRPVRAAWRM